MECLIERHEAMIQLYFVSRMRMCDLNIHDAQLKMEGGAFI